MRDTGKDKGLPVCRPRLESDVYQAALFVYEMLTGIKPFLDKLLGHQHHTHVNVMLSQLQVDGSALTPYLDSMPDKHLLGDLPQLLARATLKNPQQRCTVSELLGCIEALLAKFET